jgi:hypothetical protein
VKRQIWSLGTRSRELGQPQCLCGFEEEANWIVLIIVKPDRTADPLRESAAFIESASLWCLEGEVGSRASRRAHVVDCREHVLSVEE